MGPGPGGGQWGGRRQQNFKWQGAIHHWQGFSPEELGSFSKEEDFLTTLSKSHVFPSLLPQWLCPESIQKRREIGKPETKPEKPSIEGRLHCWSYFVCPLLWRVLIWAKRVLSLNKWTALLQGELIWLEAKFGQHQHHPVPNFPQKTQCFSDIKMSFWIFFYS